MRFCAFRSAHPRLALYAGVLSLMITVNCAPAQDAAPAPSSDPLWAAQFKDLTDTPQSLAQYKGKIAVVYFWATWCAPCQKEGPELQRVYEQFKDKDVVVVGIAVDNADKVREFTKKHGMAFPIVYGGTEAIQLGRSLGNSLGGIPFLVIIDRNGTIVERITGETKDGRVAGIVSSLLGG